MAASAVTERTSEPPKLRFVPRVRELVGYREVLANLIRKELKVKYTASFLGAVWSLLNPVVFLAVFSFVVVVTNNSFPHYPIFLLSSLLAWNLFAVSITNAARSVVDNSNLVKKISFPREILPLSSIGVALVDFALQSAILFLFILVTGYGFHPRELVLYPLALATLLAFTSAVALWVAALNVRYRDVQHLLNLGLLVWFWFTPIVYSGFLIQEKLTHHPVLGVNPWNLFLVNPLTPVALGFQRALYASVRVVVDGRPKAILPDVSLAWLAGVLALMLAACLVLLSLTWRLFFRLSGDFAEEL